MAAETKRLELSDFVVGIVPRNIVGSPALLTGEFGQAVYRAYKKEKTGRFENNPYLRLQNNGEVATGSTPFDAILVNNIINRLQGTPRTPLLADLSRPEVLAMVEGKHYTDSQSLVLRSAKDSVYPRNNPLLKYLAEHVDMARAEQEPVMVTGLRLDPWPEDEKGYKLRTTVPAEAHYDDRFLEKWNGYRFDQVDELGLPVGLSKDKGSRTWYTRNDGLSRLYLNRFLSLYSNGSDLDDSLSHGRVVILGGEATSQNS